VPDIHIHATHYTLAQRLHVFPSAPPILFHSFSPVLSNFNPLDTIHSSQFISTSCARSTLLSFTSSRISFQCLSRLMCPLQLFRTFRYICHFGNTSQRFLLVIPSIHLSMLPCVYWILRNILEFSMYVSHPYVVTGGTQSYS
jgi:hypothetical protein